MELDDMELDMNLTSCKEIAGQDSMHKDNMQEISLGGHIAHNGPDRSGRDEQDVEEESSRTEAEIEAEPLCTDTGCCTAAAFASPILGATLLLRLSAAPAALLTLGDVFAALLTTECCTAAALASLTLGVCFCICCWWC